MAFLSDASSIAMTKTSRDTDCACVLPRKSELSLNDRSLSLKYAGSIFIFACFSNRNNLET